MARFRWILVLLSLGSPLQTWAAESIYKPHWGRDRTVTGVSLATTSLLYLFDKQIINPRCPCPLTDLNPLDRTVVGNKNNDALLATDVILGVSYGAPLLIDWVAMGGFKPAFWEDTMVFAEVMAVSAVLVSATKVIVQRPIPRAYDGDPNYVNNVAGYRSFYSGHVATTMAALSAGAMMLNYRSKHKVWPWLVVGGTGLAVAAGRVAGGVHFYSDVIVGAAVGTLVGTIIPLLHHRKGGGSALMVVPQPGGAVALWTQAL